MALAALREGRTMAQLCQQYEVHPSQLSAGKAAQEPVDLAPLHAKIGQQALELDF